MNKQSTFLIILLAFLLPQDDYFEQQLDFENLNIWGGFGSIIKSDGSNTLVFGDESIHFYRLTDDSWVYNNIIESDSIDFSGHYKPIDIYQDMVVLGDIHNSRAIVYEFIDGQWLVDTILEIEDEVFSYLGWQVYMGNNMIVLVAWSATDIYRYYYFERINGDWQNTGYIDIDNYLYQGNSEIFGNSIIIANELDGLGFINEFSFTEDGVIEVTNSTIEILSENCNGLPNPCSLFGKAIDRCDNFLFIGAPGQNVAAYYPGYVYVLQKPEETWELSQVITSNDADNQDQFGSSLSCFDGKVVIGAPGNDDGGNGSGAIYVYSLNNDGWTEINKVISSDSEFGDQYGAVVSTTNEYIFVGAPMKNGLEGAVYVYELQDTSLHSNFGGSLRNGDAPLTIQFTSVPQGVPVTYEWDFNGDGFIDSIEEHPEFVYNIDGIYSVSLTVCDDHACDNELKEEYIQVNSNIIFGDVDQSGELDVGDLVLYVSFILGFTEPTTDQFLAGDVDYSGQIDILDIVMVIDAILE